MQIIVSIIIPVYRVKEEYFRQCLDSVRAIDKGNFEVILIDDGSYDHCSDICDDYVEIDSRFSVIHKQNNGASAARNDGMNRARGKYITFIDADDWVDSQEFFEIIKVAEKAEYDVIVYGGYVNLPDRQIEVRPFEQDRIFRSPDELEKIKQMVFVRDFGRMRTGAGAGVFCNTVEKLVLRSLVEQYSLSFPNTLKLSEDSYFFMEIFSLCQQVKYLNRMCYHYRQHRSSASRNAVILGYQAIALYAQAVDKFIERTGQSNEFRKAAFCRYYDLIFERIGPSYLDVKESAIKKIVRFQQDLNCYPLKEAVSIVSLGDLHGKERIKSSLLKAHMGWLLLALLLLMRKRGNRNNYEEFD